MRRFILRAALIALPVAAGAETPQDIITNVVNDHILVQFGTLDTMGQRLRDVARDDCDPASETLRASYGDAFDAWIGASHLRFGPTETDNRAFALAFWPDSRGATPRALAALIADEDKIAQSPESYAEMSIAARGFYAMEYLLYDETLSTAGDPAYHCTLVQTVAGDIAANSAAILNDWQSFYADRLIAPAPDGTYHSQEEVLKELFKAETAGLEFTSDVRMGRPLGTFDHPRASRAESWRAGRSARHVELSLIALRDLALRLAMGKPDLVAELDRDFQKALDQLAALNDPVFAGVDDPQSRLRVEVVQQSIDAIRATVREDLGPTLGVAAGFNALDGD